MKKNLKKVFAAGLAATMVMGTASVAMAAQDNTDASFTKTYIETNEGTESPEETFTFSFEKDHLTDSNINLSKEDMPEIPDSTITFGEGDAAVDDGLSKDVAVTLSQIDWPGVGVYYYKVTEDAGNTAGVTYDDTESYLKVTVAYDEGTDTYYTAFVTLNLADSDGDGITDDKTNGFVNEYSAGSLAVKKIVTGNLGDQKKEFNVTVTFTAEDDVEVNSAIYYNDDVKTPAVAIEGNGWTGTKTVTIDLKHDETVTFTNIPYGVTYTVVEDDYTADADGGYEAADYEWSDEDGKKIDSALDTVDITNNKGTVVDTGISLDSMPYLMTLALSALGALGFAGKKRKEEELF